MPGPATAVMLLPAPIALQAQHFRTGPMDADVLPSRACPTTSTSTGAWLRKDGIGAREAVATTAEGSGTLGSCAGNYDCGERSKSIMSDSALPCSNGQYQENDQTKRPLRWPKGMGPKGETSTMLWGRRKARTPQKLNGVSQSAKYPNPQEGVATASALQNPRNGSQEYPCSGRDTQGLQVFDGLQDGGCKCQLSEVRIGQGNGTPDAQHLRRSPRQLPTNVVGRLEGRLSYSVRPSQEPDQGVQDRVAVGPQHHNRISESPSLKRRRHENHLDSWSSPSLQRKTEGAKSQSRKLRDKGRGARRDGAKNSVLQPRNKVQGSSPPHPVSKAPPVNVNKLHQQSISAYLFRPSDSEEAPTTTHAVRSRAGRTSTPTWKAQVSGPFGP